MSLKQPVLKSKLAIENMRKRIFKSHRYRLRCHEEAVKKLHEWESHLETAREKLKWFKSLQSDKYIPKTTPSYPLEMEVKLCQRNVDQLEKKGEYTSPYTHGYINGKSGSINA
jgi:hypothetical protein